MKEDELKEKCREWALQWKEKTGKFPLATDWLVKQNNSPICRSRIRVLFNGYNNFRKYCKEPEETTTEKITLELIKQNCTISNNCWVWNKTKSNGYGFIKRKMTHRVVYELVNGEIPEGLIIRHKCDNKPCCNPDHLEIGTYKDNALDRLERVNYFRSNTNISAKTRNLSLVEKIRFYINNTKKTLNNCLESIIKKYDNTGYLSVSYNKKSYLLHRLIVAQNENLDYNDKSWVARHICNNKRCINPEHLKSGTLNDNALDSREYSKNTKLTKEQVIEIKTDWKNNSSSYKYKKDFDGYWSSKFKVSIDCIKYIRTNKRWKDIII